MQRSIPLAVVAAAAAVALAGAPAALASPKASEFGRHVSDCAQAHLGQRDGAPAVTCTHDGVTMTFTKFGAMVLHMKQHHS